MEFMMFPVLKSYEEIEIIKNFNWIRMFSDLTHVRTVFPFLSYHCTSFDVPNFVSNWSSCCCCSFEPLMKWDTQFWEQLEYLIVHEASILVLVSKFATFSTSNQTSHMFFRKIDFLLRAWEISDLLRPKK